MDPTAACWTQNGTSYQGMEQTWGFGILPGWVIPWNAGMRFLNTGPDIPHLIIATNTQGGRLLTDPVASLRTASGSRLVKVRPLRSPGAVRAWDLGPVPDGSVVWFQVHVRRLKRYPAQAWLKLYAGVTASGSVDWSLPVISPNATLRSG
jgi:hypothetical protein